MADQLCTTAQVKTRVEVTDANDDALISELIDQVSDWILDFTKRQFVGTAAVTYVVDTGAGGVIEVPRGIRAVTALDIASSDQPDTGGTYATSIAAADILLRPNSLFRRPGWPAVRILIKSSGAGRLAAALNGARITGDWGWASVPPAIAGVAIDAVVTAFNARQGGASDTIGADRTAIYPWASYFTAESPQYRILDRYRAGQAIGIA